MKGVATRRATSIDGNAGGKPCRSAAPLNASHMMRAQVSVSPLTVRRSSMAMSRPSLPRILHPEIGPAHQVAVEQGLAAALGHDAPGLEHVAALGGDQRGGHVLLDEQHGQTLLAMEHLQHVQDRVHDARHDAEARLVEHQEARPRHERARDRQHLALAAGERARALVDALAQHREEAEDPLEHLLAALRVAVAEGAEAQVLGHREAAEETPALGDEREAEGDPVRGLDVVDAAAGGPELPAPRSEQAREGPGQRGLARAVGPIHSDAWTGWVRVSGAPEELYTTGRSTDDAKGPN